MSQNNEWRSAFDEASSYQQNVRALQRGMSRGDNAQRNTVLSVAVDKCAYPYAAIDRIARPDRLPDPLDASILRSILDEEAENQTSKARSAVAQLLQHQPELRFEVSPLSKSEYPTAFTTTVLQTGHPEYALPFTGSSPGDHALYQAMKGSHHDSDTARAVLDQVDTFSATQLIDAFGHFLGYTPDLFTNLDYQNPITPDPDVDAVFEAMREAGMPWQHKGVSFSFFLTDFDRDLTHAMNALLVAHEDGGLDCASLIEENIEQFHSMSKQQLNNTYRIVTEFNREIDRTAINYLTRERLLPDASVLDQVTDRSTETAQLLQQRLSERIDNAARLLS